MQGASWQRLTDVSMRQPVPRKHDKSPRSRHGGGGVVVVVVVVIVVVEVVVVVVVVDVVVDEVEVVV